MLNIGPNWPEMLNWVFGQQKDCQYIHRKTGQYNTKILQEISVTGVEAFMMDMKYDIRKSNRLLKRLTRNMYLYYIQFRLWHSRIATNITLIEMNTIEDDQCEYCNEPDYITHAFIICEKA